MGLEKAVAKATHLSLSNHWSITTLYLPLATPNEQVQH